MKSPITPSEYTLILVPRVKSAMNRRYTIPWPRKRSNDFDTRNIGEPVEIVGGTEKSFAAGVEVFVPQGFSHCGGLLITVLLKSSKMYPHDLHVWAPESFKVSHIGHFFGLAVLYLN